MNAMHLWGPQESGPLYQARASPTQGASPKDGIPASPTKSASLENHRSQQEQQTKGKAGTGEGILEVKQDNAKKRPVGLGV